MADAQVLEVEGPEGDRQVRLSSPDRLMWPDAGITKGDLAAYVVAVGDPLVQHSVTGPITLQRFPDGVDGEEFYQKNPPKGMPDWVAHGLVHVPARPPPPADRHRRGGHRGLGGADEHLRSTRGRCARPTSTTPTSCGSTSTRSRAGFADAVEAAYALREVLTEVGLDRLGEDVSGNRGVHVYARIAPTHEFLEVRHGVIAIARELERRLPDLVTTVVVEGGAGGTRLRRLQPGLPRPDHRLGLQPAAAPGAPVSMPVTWTSSARSTPGTSPSSRSPTARGPRRRLGGHRGRGRRRRRRPGPVAARRRGAGARRAQLPARLPEDARGAAAGAAQQAPHRQGGCRVPGAQGGA